ncbi:GntR family transcriptional regulator [Oceanivirga salmonicida]|uniref:GntR family transcriptional regulator n=1 Tax=Oceanivirga salmonicida TaxID=1769291 RepID=UPI00082F1C02|nr:GntR family transcriptional regulator [Oceanivirga salmonicida]
MKMIINNTSSKPIYKQIKDNIIAQILNGELKNGEQLPSIRILASDIKISIMTIKKAYDELEEEGYIVTTQGKGSYISSASTTLANEAKMQEIEGYILQVVGLSKKYGVDKEEILELFELLYKED